MGHDHHLQHGIQYTSQKGQLGMDKSKWIPGEDYFVQLVIWVQ